jgi:hypothetical protein
MRATINLYTRNHFLWVHKSKNKSLNIKFSHTKPNELNKLKITDESSLSRGMIYKKLSTGRVKKSSWKRLEQKKERSIYEGIDGVGIDTGKKGKLRVKK